MGRLIWLLIFLFYISQCQVACSSSSLFSSSSSSSTHHLCLDDQRSALLQFKQMFTTNSSASLLCDNSAGTTTPYPKTDSGNESSSIDCCLWDGVTCDRFTGHVIGLDLSCSQLYGTIHPNSSSLFRLSHLQRLNLAFNNFNHSPISSWFRRFASLTHLNLSFSKFSGSIPSEISYLSKLVSLRLSSRDGLLRLEPHNFQMMLKNLTQLQELVLYRVNISSVLPNSLMNLSSLMTLDLGWTGLQGYLPENIFHLPNLQQLYLFDNIALTGAFPKVNWSSGDSLRILELSVRYFQNFQAMRNVLETRMDLEYMGQRYYRDSVELVMKGVVVELVNVLTIFTIIDFSGNQFKGEIPSVIGMLHSLRLLNLSHNNLTGHIPLSLENLALLESLDLSSNQLTGEIPRQLTSLTFLAVLNFSRNHLVGPIPQGRQFDTFQNGSYDGNLALCGLPLSKQCVGDETSQDQPPPMLQPEEDSDFVNGFTWKAVVMGYGCGMVFGLVVGYLTFLTRKPEWFIRVVEEELLQKAKRTNMIGYRRGGRRN